MRSLLFTIVFYVVTALFLILGSPLLAAPRAWAMVGLRAHARTVTWLLRVIVGTRTEVRNHDRLPNGPCLIVSKHQSAWETFALIPLLKDPAIVLKTELTRIPLYGWFCRKFEHIAVDRDRGPSALRDMIKTARARCAEGRQILIFAEGTRVDPGAEPDNKPGFVALYNGLDVPCVPVALNSGLYWPARQHQHYAGTIIVAFGEPLPAGLARKDFRNRVVERVETMSTALVKEAAAVPTPPPTVAAALQRLDRIKIEH
ncbi:MAG: lysophospholipid acyltransferase family protein [Pseudomonadota bacterium]